jgi:hypothetical protein
MSKISIFLGWEYNLMMFRTEGREFLITLLLDSLNLGLFNDPLK